MVTHGKLHQIIWEFTDTPNADVQYWEGFVDANGEFVPLGVNKIHVENKKEEYDEEGNLIHKASNDLDQLLDIIRKYEPAESIVYLEAFVKERI
jgi:hypothetical protein